MLKLVYKAGNMSSNNKINVLTGANLVHKNSILQV